MPAETRRRDPQELVVGGNGPEVWDSSAVSSWLSSIGLAQYAATFQEKAISGKMLLRLTDEKLARIVTDEFHRERILDELEGLKSRPASQAASLDDTVVSYAPSPAASSSQNH